MCVFIQSFILLDVYVPIILSLIYICYSVYIVLSVCVYMTLLSSFGKFHADKEFSA